MGDSKLILNAKQRLFRNKTAIKQKVKDTLEPPRAIFAELSGYASKETLANLPNQIS